MTHHRPYLRLALMTFLHFMAMYALMYVMVNTLGNVLPNINQLYMALLMVCPMVLFEVWIMDSMYPNKTANHLILIGSALCLVATFFLIRYQVGIGDSDLLRSMIPHHAGAVLMCEEATITDPQVQQLCDNILQGQQAEITWMQTKLKSLGQ